jgi:hypothetical protein
MSQREEAELHVHGFVYALLTTTRKELAVLEHGITLDSDTEDSETVKKCIERQEKLARAFYDAMTEGQSFERVNAYREEFYEKVDKLAGKVDICNFVRVTH